MHSTDNTPSSEPERSSSAPGFEFTDAELPTESQEARFARETQRLVDYTESAVISLLIDRGYEEVDDGNYFELESLEQLKDQLAQFLGLRDASPYEQEVEESFLTNEFDDEPHDDPEAHLEPAQLDFEVHRSLVRRDEFGEVSERLLLVEPKIQKDGDTVWCFPDVMRNAEGQQVLSRQKSDAPLLLVFHREDDGIGFSVHFTPSAIDEMFTKGAEDLRDLPPSLRNDIGALAIQFCRGIEWPGADEVGLSDIQLRQPHSIDHGARSFDLTVEPLGIFRVMLAPEPGGSSVRMGMQALELFGTPEE
jgi:hypothetical protein